MARPTVLSAVSQAGLENMWLYLASAPQKHAFRLETLEHLISLVEVLCRVNQTYTLTAFFLQFRLQLVGKINGSVPTPAESVHKFKWKIRQSIINTQGPTFHLWQYFCIDSLEQFQNSSVNCLSRGGRHFLDVLKFISERKFSHQQTIFLELFKNIDPFRVN